VAYTAPDLYTIYQGLFGVSGYIIPIIFVAIIGAVAWKKGWLKQMPITIHDFQTFDGSLRLKKRKGRLVKKKGEQGGNRELEFRNGEKWQLPSFDDMVLDVKGKPHLYIESTSKGQHKIMKKEEIGSEIFLKAKESAAVDFWKETEDSKADLRWTKKDLIDKLYPLIALIIVATMAIVMLFGTMNYGIIPLLDRADAYLARTEEQMTLSTKILDKAVQFMSVLNNTGIINLNVPIEPVATGNTSV